MIFTQKINIIKDFNQASITRLNNYSNLLFHYSYFITIITGEDQQKFIYTLDTKNGNSSLLYNDSCK